MSKQSLDGILESLWDCAIRTEHGSGYTASQKTILTAKAALLKAIKSAKPDWSKENHADNDAQVAYAIGGKKALELYKQNLIDLFGGK